MKKEAKNLHIVLQYGVYLAAFIFFAWLSYHIPFSADDWRWGTDIGIKELLGATQNSRYAGNFLVVIMTRFPLVNMIVMGFVPCIISMLITKLAIRKKNEPLSYAFFFVLASILFLCAGSRIWSETNGWIAGFANFVVSAVFVLVNLLVWTQTMGPEYSHKKDSVLICILMFLVSFVGQLFIENLAIINVILSLVFLCVYYRQTKHISFKYVSMTLGAILGLIVMFSSSLYSNLFYTGEALNGYRQILFLSQNSIGELIFSFVYQCARLVVRIGEENVVLTISVLISLALRLNIRVRDKGTITLAVSNLAFCVYYLIIGAFGVTYSSDDFKSAMISAVINLLYVLLVFFELFVLCRREETDAKKVLFYWTFALFTIVPLLFTSENGARLLYTFETVSVVIVVTLLYPLFSKLSYKKMLIFTVLAVLIAVLPATRYFVIYTANKDCENQRIELIEEAVENEQSSVMLERFPYPEYAPRSTPQSEEAMEDFKNFFNVPDALEITIE